MPDQSLVNPTVAESGVDGLQPAPATGPAEAASAAASAEAEPVKRAFPAPAALPTQQGPAGLRFDFNDGCRVVVDEAEAAWRLRLRDLDTGNILFETELKSGRINSTKRYYVRFRIEALQKDLVVFSHDYAAAGHAVLIQFPIGTLGDSIGWLPYAAKFQARHKCRLTCAMAGELIPLFRDSYPDIAFVAHEEVNPETYYATYNMGLFFDDKDGVYQPCDFRLVGLHRTAGFILGVDPSEQVTAFLGLRCGGQPRLSPSVRTGKGAERCPRQ